MRPYRALASQARRSSYGGGFDSPESGGAYGVGSAPASYGKLGKFDHATKQLQEAEAEGRNRSKEHFSVKPTMEEGGGVPVFKMNIVKKTQAEIDAENLGMGGADVPGLTDAQRERMRVRRNKRIAREAAMQKMRKGLEIFNWGRSNIGFANSGDSNIGFFNKGDGNKGFFNHGSYNAGVFCVGSDNVGALIYGSGNVGTLIFGDRNRGVDVWGSNLRGVFCTDSKFLKLRLKLLGGVFLLVVLSIPTIMSRIERRKRIAWLKAMGEEPTEENIARMMQRKTF